MDNLLQNSGKFTDRSGRVDVRVEADRDHRWAVLTVWDTGMGLEPDMLPHLFETFAQADRSKGGLGLGLSLVRGVVELHGGRVRAASAGPGRGAEFTITLPLEPEPAALSNVPAVAPPQSKRRLSILVIEDNQDAADSLRMLLELYGHEVTVAYSGPAGVQAASEVRPEVILCDIGLPGLDGYGVVEALRRERWPDKLGSADGMDGNVPFPPDSSEAGAAAGSQARTIMSPEPLARSRAFDMAARTGLGPRLRAASWRRQSRPGRPRRLPGPSPTDPAVP